MQTYANICKPAGKLAKNHQMDPDGSSWRSQWHSHRIISFAEVWSNLPFSMRSAGKQQGQQCWPVIQNHLMTWWLLHESAWLLHDEWLDLFWSWFWSEHPERPQERDPYFQLMRDAPPQPRSRGRRKAKPRDAKGHRGRKHEKVYGSVWKCLNRLGNPLKAFSMSQDALFNDGYLHPEIVQNMEEFSGLWIPSRWGGPSPSPCLSEFVSAAIE